MSFTQIALLHSLLFPSICMHPHSPPSLCTSIMLSMNVLLPALISLYLSVSTVCMLFLLSIYIHNAVYVLLPIMLSISVFLLLAGWMGVRGGLSQLIYHIKYQPSSAFSLPLFLIPSFTRLSLLFSHFFPSLPFLHLLPFTSLLLTCPIHFFHHSFPPNTLSLTLPLSFPHTSPSEPSSAFVKVPISLTFFLTTSICLFTPPPASPSWPSVLISQVPPPPAYIHTLALSPYHVRFGVICSGTICLIIQKNPVMQKDFLTNHNNGFWQCSALIFWR